MKTYSLLLIIIVFNACKIAEQTNPVITYEAKTRGSSIYFIATNSEISYRDNKTSKTIVLESKDWDGLLNLIHTIELKEMGNYSPDSEDRTFDAALHANISISMDSIDYTSQTFDHGNPPKELKPLIDKLFDYLNKDE